jgi:hypothetical protein
VKYTKLPKLSTNCSAITATPCNYVKGGPRYSEKELVKSVVAVLTIKQPTE